MNDTSTEAQESLLAAHHARLNALLAGDVEALGKVVGEDLVFVSAFGKAVTRPQVFADIRAGRMKIERMESSDFDIRIYGDIGILIYQADTKVIDGTVTVEGMTRNTTVYANRNGGWQLVSQHQSRIAE